MASLKPISKTAIPSAIERALRYRLLNEPMEAESICLDVLATEPDHNEALVTLLLALTDQFETEFVAALGRAKEVLSRLADPYDRAYYEGLIYERWAKAQATKDVPHHIVSGWLRQAMRSYETAESVAASSAGRADNPDAALRWNTCARILERIEGTGESTAGHRGESTAEDFDESDFDEEAPSR
jgi:hypothetical protein